jgi:hypothetical protein
MQEYSEDDLQGKSRLYKEFPFMQAFPFDDYEITLEQEEDFATLAGIDPVVISEAGTFVTPEFVNFYYTSDGTRISLSFYTYDIRYILENCKSIKKIDEVRFNLDSGLVSDSLIEKILSIRSGEKFLKKLGSSLIVGRSFDSLLDDMLKDKDHNLTKTELNKIKAKYRTISEDSYSDDIKASIGSFYDIHIHHIKILLGVVIASKIY